MRDISDQTLFVSKHFNESFSGTSVSKYKEDKIYMSEPLYGDPYNLVHRLEIVDIATGAYEVKPRLDSTQSLEALEFVSLRRRVLRDCVKFINFAFWIKCHFNVGI